jgi:hypothetical protein
MNPMAAAPGSGIKFHKTKKTDEPKQLRSGEPRRCECRLARIPLWSRGILTEFEQIRAIELAEAGLGNWESWGGEKGKVGP